MATDVMGAGDAAASVTPNRLRAGQSVERPLPGANHGWAERLRRRHHRNRVVDRLISVAVAAAVLGLAELSNRRGWVSDLVLPAPTEVWDALWAGFESGLFGKHLVATVKSVVIGFIVAAAAGMLIGSLLAIYPRLERIFYPFIVALQTLPKVALAPIFVIWLGFGPVMVVTVAAVVAFFPVLVNTLQGMRLRDRDQAELMQSLGATKWQVFRYVRLPSSTPFVFAGLNLGAVFSVLGVVVAEMVGAQEGLAVLMLSQKAAFNVPAVFAILVILSMLGLAVFMMMSAVEKKVTFWAQEHHAR